MKHISGMERCVGQKLNGMTDASAVCQTAVEIRTSGRSPLWPISRNFKTSKGNNSNLFAFRDIRVSSLDKPISGLQPHDRTCFEPLRSLSSDPSKYQYFALWVLLREIKCGEVGGDGEPKFVPGPFQGMELDGHGPQLPYLPRAITLGKK